MPDPVDVPKPGPAAKPSDLGEAIAKFATNPADAEAQKKLIEAANFQKEKIAGASGTALTALQEQIQKMQKDLTEQMVKYPKVAEAINGLRGSIEGRAMAIVKAAEGLSKKAENGLSGMMSKGLDMVTKAGTFMKETLAGLGTEGAEALAFVLNLIGWKAGADLLNNWANNPERQVLTIKKILAGYGDKVNFLLDDANPQNDVKACGRLQFLHQRNESMNKIMASKNSLLQPQKFNEFITQLVDERLKKPHTGTAPIAMINLREDAEEFIKTTDVAFKEHQKLYPPGAPAAPAAPAVPAGR